jgi:hypothetical protein
MPVSAKERKRLSRAKQNPVLGVASKVKRFLLAHPDQVPVVAAFMPTLVEKGKKGRRVIVVKPLAIHPHEVEAETGSSGTPKF